MTKRVPILPTLLVLIATGVMVRLGFWQIDRLHQKEAMLDQYQHALAQTHVTDLGRDLLIDGPFEYTHVKLVCEPSGPQGMHAGRNASGEAGWAHVVPCQFPFARRGVGAADVTIGWSRDLNVVAWTGGEVSGVVVPANQGRMRIVADPPLAGLQPNAKPDPRDIPNNHLSYAVQWFLFAGLALVIYALALRKRWGE